MAFYSRKAKTSLNMRQARDINVEYKGTSSICSGEKEIVQITWKTVQPDRDHELTLYGDEFWELLDKMLDTVHLVRGDYNSYIDAKDAQ